MGRNKVEVGVGESIQIEGEDQAGDKVGAEWLTQR